MSEPIGPAGQPTHKFLVHNVGDDVGVAVVDVGKGEEVIAVYMDTEESVRLVAKDDIPLGHKIALTDLSANSPVREYRMQIGTTCSAIAAGEHVHTHNIQSARWSLLQTSKEGGAESNEADRVSA